MCGICGKLNFDPNNGVSKDLLKSMADSIIHRGPDDDGYYVSGQIGLGFRRLSIIDLGGGHQPISNEDGTVWIVFNGEIYNYKELTRDLESKGHIFRTRTDTEAIVHLYEEYGEACVEKLRGMFAFAIWDNRQKLLFLARDRVGIKPLYYHLGKQSLIFASEIKAILADPVVEFQPAPAMIDRFLSFYYTPGDETLFQGILKLEPGSCMTVQDGRMRIRQYWDLNFSPVERNQQDAEEELLTLLEESVQLHMISDVPVGFLLSGGVDSTAMLGFAAGKTEKAISSFTIGFSEPNVTDERPYAQLAASRYGSKHYEMTIGARDFADFMPSYAWHMEEPVCEPPAVALYYISRLARDYVKVLISGEGGDEAFAGYPNYRSVLWLERIKSALGPMNGLLAGGLSFANRFHSLGRLSKYISMLQTPFDSYYFSRTSSPQNFFNSHAEELYTKEFALLTDKRHSLSAAAKYLHNGAAGDFLSKMLYVDTKTWLPDDLLIKADKMTMANSVELRVPLLDHKILEFAATLPSRLKVHGFTTKYIAKKALSGRVPREIVKRKKTGFPVPYDTWMRKELKDWVRGILFDRETVDRGYFQKKTIERLLADDTQSQKYAKEIFSLVTLELWHRAFSERKLTVAGPQPSNLTCQARNEN